MRHSIPAALLAVFTATTALGQDNAAPVVNPLAKVLNRRPLQPRGPGGGPLVACAVIGRRRQNQTAVMQP